HRQHDRGARSDARATARRRARRRRARAPRAPRGRRGRGAGLGARARARAPGHSLPAGARMMCRRWSVLPVALVLSLASAAATARSLEDRLRERIPESTRLALALTEEDEIALGRRASARLLGVAPLVEDRGVQDYVNRVGRWIAQGSGRPNLPWRFGVIDSAD